MNREKSTPQSKIPVYGTAREITEALNTMAKEKAASQKQPDSTHPQTSAQTIPNSPSPKTIGFVLLLVLIISIAIAIYLLTSKSALQKPQLTLPTKADQESVKKIKAATNYDWQYFATSKFKGASEEKLAALLFLHEEESASFALFTAKNSLLDSQSLKTLNLENVNEEVNKDSLQRLIENLIMIQKLQKGNNEAQIHIERLTILESYFKKYQPLETDIIPSSADSITLDSHPAPNQKALMELLLKRYNIFLNSFI